MPTRSSRLQLNDRIRVCALGLIVALLVAITFRGALIELAKRWSTQEEYSHGFLIPFVALWLLWLRRDALIANISPPSWTGVLLILLALLAQMIGQLSAIFILAQIGFIIALFGIILVIGGYDLLKVAFTPVAFLFFAIPLPYFIDAALSLDLQLLSSRLGVGLIELFRIPVYLEGNLIDLGVYKLQVVDACSGLRYLFPLFSLSFLAAYLFQAPLWQRTVVLLSSIPITIAMNGFRIGLIGVTVDRWGPRMAEGVLHLFEGWIIFLASACVLLLELYLLARTSGKTFSEAFGIAQGAFLPSSRPVKPMQTKPLYVCLLLVSATLLSGPLLSRRFEIVPERNRFASFPVQIGDWHGNPSMLDPEVEQSLAVDDYTISDYSDPAGKIVNLYVAYYASQRTGESPHSPLVCIPGDGWSITKFERTNYGADPINRAVISRNGSKQLVYYWYQERGRKISNEYWAKWYLLLDAITMNRSDGALVRLITPISQGEREQDADARLGLFIQNMGSTLNRFLPAENTLRATAERRNVESRTQ